MVLYAGADESEEKYLDRIKSKYTNEELILELYKRQKEYLKKEMYFAEEYVDKFTHEILITRYQKQIEVLERERDYMEAKLNSPHNFDRGLSEYLDFYFSEIENLLQDLSINLKLKNTLEEAIKRHKREKYKTSPIAMVEEILQIISNFSNK